MNSMGAMRALDLTKQFHGVKSKEKQNLLKYTPTRP
jgi:hypothetical protein